LFYELKHLLPYFGIVAHDLFFYHANLLAIKFVGKMWLAVRILSNVYLSFVGNIE
jgi:hypothetical protein